MIKCVSWNERTEYGPIKSSKKIKPHQMTFEETKNETDQCRNVLAVFEWRTAIQKQKPNKWNTDTQLTLYKFA